MNKLEILLVCEIFLEWWYCWIQFIQPGFKSWFKYCRHFAHLFPCNQEMFEEDIVCNQCQFFFLFKSLSCFSMTWSSLALILAIACHSITNQRTQEHFGIILQKTSTTNMNEDYLYEDPYALPPVPARSNRHHVPRAVKAPQAVETLPLGPTKGIANYIC